MSEYTRIAERARAHFEGIELEISANDWGRGEKLYAEDIRKAIIADYESRGEPLPIYPQHLLWICAAAAKERVLEARGSL